MNTITATSPSTSPEFISESAYSIIFSLGILLVVIAIGFACYFYGTHGLSTATADLNHQRASPIAAANSLSQSADNRPPLLGKQGLGEGLLSTYPKVTYSQVKLQYGNLTGSCCPICLADYKDDEMLLLLPNCAHFFHVKCGNQWLRLHPTCPICRKSPVSRPLPVSLQSASRLLIQDDSSERQNFQSDDNYVV
ncbi:43kDa postsynaptic protein [Parasponia andersonii]|uniref:43kDa postsynaptic protein n=1 Tax=Parasponia andersonii TaxID=3476 RepID=A0A2P5DAC2_PARAD|nr:43kDa postsynaptic protein [Parasponia andersonii]